MAPFASGPAPRWEPGSAVFSSSNRNCPTASTPCRSRGSSSLLASAALLAARRLLPAGAPSSRRPSSSPAALRPAFFGAAAFFGRTRPSCGRSSCARGLLRCGLASGLLLRQRPSCGRPPASPSPARVAVRWLGFLRYSPVGTPSRVVGCSRAVEPRAGPAILRGMVVCHARQCRTCPEARRTNPAHISAIVLRRICDPASDVDARSTVLHLDWSAVNGPSFR